MFSEVGFLSSLRMTMAGRAKEKKKQQGDDIPQRPWILQYRQHNRKDPKRVVEDLHRDAAQGMQEKMSLIKKDKSTRPHKAKEAKSNQPLYENNMNKVGLLRN